jgi:glutathione S-transferase
MALVVIVAALAIAEYIAFMIQCGQARGRYGVAAPAQSGHPIFERYFRVQQNTLEQLIVFLPALFGFAFYVSPTWAAPIGVVFIIGRGLFARGYVIDPAKRGPGFLLTMLANSVLLIGTLVGAVLEFASGA